MHLSELKEVSIPNNYYGVLGKGLYGGVMTQLSNNWRVVYVHVILSSLKFQDMCYSVCILLLLFKLFLIFIGPPPTYNSYYASAFNVSL